MRETSTVIPATAGIQKNELPEGWEECELKEVLQVIRGISFKSSEKLLEPGKETVVCLRTANVQENIDWDNLWWVPENFVKRDEQFIKENDILMSNANSYELVGKVSLVKEIPEKATLGAFITMLRAREGADPKFFFYQLRSYRVANEIRSRASTTTNISNVSTSKLKNIPLQVAPLEQQKQIVAKIEELFSHIDAGIKALQKAKRLLKQYRQSVLKAAVTGEITKAWRKANKDKLEPASRLLQRILKERREKWEQQQLEKFKAKGKIPKDDKWKEKYKDPEIAVADTAREELPEGWQFLLIKDFAHTTSGGTPKRGVAEYYNGDIPWVKSGDLNDGILNEAEEYITPLGLEKSSAKLFRPGTLLIALYGATIGRLSILGFEASTNQAVCGISVPDYVDVKYLFHYFLSIRKKFIAQGQGGAQLNINQQIVKETVVPLPHPEEQKRIVAKIEGMLNGSRKMEKEIDSQIRKSETNKQSVLASAFSGKLQ